MHVDTQYTPDYQDNLAAHVLRLAADLHLPLDALTHVLGIVAQRGAGKCLSEESQVVDPMTGTLHTIREVVEHSHLTHAFSLNENSRVVSAPIVSKVNSGVQECFKVVFASGRSVVTTKEHPFLTIDGWQRLEALHVGESAALPKRIPFPSETRSLPDAEIDLLAVLLAEGNCTQRNVSFCTTDPCILEIVSVAAAAVGQKVKHHNISKGCEYHLVGGELGAPHYTRAMLHRYGMAGKKAVCKSLPDVIYSLPPQQLARFIGLFWMCDGYVDRRGPALALASEQLVRQLQHLLLRFGIQSRVTPKRASYRGKIFASWRLTVYASSHQAFFDTILLWGEKRERLANLCLLNKNSNIGFPTVSQEFAERVQRLAQARSGRWNGAALKEVAQRIGWNTPYYWVTKLFSPGRTLSMNKFQAFCEVYGCAEIYRWIWDSDLFWDRIVEIEPVGLRQTYDLSVPPTACFIANDILVHNSYTASVLMEEMVEHGLFVGYIDPLGIAWGIRASADGERAGYPVLILGGRHSDLPLDPAAGSIVSQFVLESRQPFILDLSLFEDEDEQRQFVAEFIRGFRLHEEVLCHLIVDEADLFAPQVPQSPMAQRSLTAMNRLTRRFRYKGMGCTLITQRPAELNKSVLGQLDLLLALRVISPQDSKALDDWIKRNAGEAERAQFLATLSGLPTGTAWAWSPQWLHLFRQVAIRTRRTFDSSATPKAGMKRATPRQLAEIDLTHLGEQMEALVERARENDPVQLRTRIRQLEGMLRSAGTQQGDPGASQYETVQALTLQLRQLEEENRRQRTELERVRATLAEYEQQRASGDSPDHVAHTLQTPGLHAANVNFERAEIGQFFAGVGVTGSDGGAPPANVNRGGSASPIAVEQIEEAPAIAAPPTNPLEQLRQSEKQLLARLVKQVRQLSPSEKLFFVWLLEHDEQPVTSRELADAVSIDQGATRRSRTGLLVDLPFIRRTGTQRFVFKATFGSYCRNYFKSIADIQVLVQRLVQAARRA